MSPDTTGGNQSCQAETLMSCWVLALTGELGKSLWGTV